VFNLKTKHKQKVIYILRNCSLYFWIDVLTVLTIVRIFEGRREEYLIPKFLSPFCDYLLSVYKFTSVGVVVH
jgi:hypothetical protein